MRQATELKINRDEFALLYLLQNFRQELQKVLTRYVHILLIFVLKKMSALSATKNQTKISVRHFFPNKMKIANSTKDHDVQTDNK